MALEATLTLYLTSLFYNCLPDLDVWDLFYQFRDTSNILRINFSLSETFFDRYPPLFFLLFREFAVFSAYDVAHMRFFTHWIMAFGVACVYAAVRILAYDLSALLPNYRHKTGQRHLISLTSAFAAWLLTISSVYVINNSLEFVHEVVLLGLVPLYILCLFESRKLRRPLPTLILGVITGIGFLTKEYWPIVLGIFLIYPLYLTWRYFKASPAKPHQCWALLPLLTIVTGAIVCYWRYDDTSLKHMLAIAVFTALALLGVLIYWFQAGRHDRRLGLPLASWLTAVVLSSAQYVYKLHLAEETGQSFLNWLKNRPWALILRHNIIQLELFVPGCIILILLITALLCTKSKTYTYPRTLRLWTGAMVFQMLGLFALNTLLTLEEPRFFSPVASLIPMAFALSLVPLWSRRGSALWTVALLSATFSLCLAGSLPTFQGHSLAWYKITEIRQPYTGFDIINYINEPNTQDFLQACRLSLTPKNNKSHRRTILCYQPPADPIVDLQLEPDIAYAYLEMEQDFQLEHRVVHVIHDPNEELPIPELELVVTFERLKENNGILDNQRHHPLKKTYPSRAKMPAELSRRLASAYPQLQFRPLLSLESEFVRINLFTPMP